MENNYIFAKPCRRCHKTVEFEVPVDGYEAMKAGAHIQNALPMLTAGQREMMISGICEPCFDLLFADDEGD